MARYARCANPKCRIVLDLDRCPEGAPCHKCGHTRRAPLGGTEPAASTTAANGRRAVVPVLAGLVLLIAALACAGWMLARQEPEPAGSTALTEPSPPPGSELESTPEPEPVPLPEPEPEIVSAPEPVSIPEPAEEPPPPAPAAPATIYTRSEGLDEFYGTYSPGTRPEVVRYDERANLRMDIRTLRFAMDWEPEHTVYEGPVYHWRGRAEALLPAEERDGEALLVDIVARRLYTLPPEAVRYQGDAAHVDRTARVEIRHALVQPLAAINAGMRHLLFAAAGPPDETPRLFGIVYDGVPLPVITP